MSGAIRNLAYKTSFKTTTGQSTQGGLARIGKLQACLAFISKIFHENPLSLYFLTDIEDVPIILLILCIQLHLIPVFRDERFHGLIFGIFF